MTVDYRGAAGAPGNGTFYGMQVARGVAALLVVLFHASLTLQARHMTGVFDRGGIGVDIFFVISGFVIYLTAQGKPWRTFLARRLARIVPLYWLFLTAKLALIVVSGRDPTGMANDPLYLLGSYVFLPLRSVYPLIGAGWTLNFEMYFYVIAAVVLGMLPARRFAMALTLYMGATVLAGGVLRGWTSAADVPLLGLLSPLCLEFLAGIWIARYWGRGRRWPAWLSGVVIGAAVVAIAIGPADLHYTPWRALYWGIPAALVIAGLVQLEPVVGFRRWTLPLLLGDASYSIYLAHTAVLPLFDPLVRRLPPYAVLQGAALVLGSAVTGVMVHLLIERRLVRWSSRWLGLRARPPGPAAADSGVTKAE
ncbi:acyltransferase [Sphingomonas sp.]|uniref:acyltransferase family protein n=1 Tax=Sphingomonas sp. TaxID=28214 RepID=UPI002896A91A|nr:acyltransferase [Sphingomonas sp.]